MPLLQYRCPSCGKEFEELVKKFDDKVVCPDCGTAAERSYSGTMFSATGTHPNIAAETARRAAVADKYVLITQLYFRAARTEFFLSAQCERGAPLRNAVLHGCRPLPIIASRKKMRTTSDV